MEKRAEHTASSSPARGIYFLAAAAVCLVVVIASGSFSGKDNFHRTEAERFEKLLHRKEQLVEEEFSRLESQFREGVPIEIMDQRSSYYQELADSKGISIFYYEDGALRYWSDHSIPLPGSWSPRYERNFLTMRNADYLSVASRMNGGILLGLIELRTHYPFQNDFLVNGFQHDFSLDPDVRLELVESDGFIPVRNSQGNYLFSLDFSETEEGDRGIQATVIAAYLLFFCLTFLGICRIIETSTGRRKWFWIGACTLFIAGSMLAILEFSVPASIAQSELFQPELFASSYFASLGNLLVITLASLALVTLYYLYGNLKGVRSARVRRITGFLLLAAASLVLLLIEELIRILVLDSTISFEVHRVTTLTGYSLTGLLVVVMWFTIMGLMMDRALLLLSRNLFRSLLYGVAAFSAVMMAAALLPGHRASWIGWVSLILFLGAHLYMRIPRTGRIPFSRFIFLLLFISVFMVMRLQRYNHENVERQKEVELVKLSSEHDPVAEMLFSEMSMAIRNDSIIAGFLGRPFTDIDPLIERLQRNYFTGYWTKYDLQVTVCMPDDQLYLQPPDDEYLHCYSFFDGMIQGNGVEIPGSDFFFLDNLNGRISYLASIPFFDPPSEHRLFIELDSKILSDELGYPELLLDDTYNTFRRSGFSFAKYNHGKLITQDGTFPYRRSVDFYTEGKEMFEQVTVDGYDHSIYNVNGTNTIIVGSPAVTPVDNLISFSYIFALDFLLLALVYLLVTLQITRLGINRSFKNRIQYSMVGILFLTFALICSGTTFFIIQQYRAKHNDNLRSTMRSVYVELLHKVEFEEDLRNWYSEEYYNLDELLRKFSNVFYTDINLYDRQGDLLATSRSEIFDRQLLSLRMNRVVYEILAAGGGSEFIHSEHIGELNYISAYVPLLNSDNNLLAYLNLPYFTQSGALTRDVTNLVVAVVNIYMILLLVILLLSVFLADRITQPLRMLQERIARVSLSSKNEMIRYERNDEIRGLVEEYNYMVQELERSAVLLAQSERESAWREMAKQIAHEIKNPLTPMKLNVQHLQRTVESGKHDREMVRRIAETLIEQIDSLTAIANEFSDFAKMPRARNERVNLVTQLRNLLQLFESSERATIGLDLAGKKKAYVFADREQLMRVFINLVKNGLQSIPDKREGRIHIALELPDDHHVRVGIRDNGKGIPEEIKESLFQPNFTTKSAGMGMGLAISYNIIRALGGKIWYETVMNEGTTFYVELPRVE